MIKEKIDLNNTDELLKIATSDEKVISPKINHDIIIFFNYFNIRPGRFKIKNDVLYAVYKQWSKNPKSKRTFVKFSNRILEKNFHGYSFISVEALKLHEDLYTFLNNKVRPVEKVRSYKNHFESFLRYFGFKSGDFFIRESSIYYLYDEWTYKNKNKKPLGEMVILKFCRMYLPTKRIKENNRIVNYLGIDKNNMKPTLEQLDFASKWNEIRREKKSK